MDEGVHNVRAALAVLCQIAIAITILGYWLYRMDERPSRLLLKWILSAALGVAIYVAARFMPMLVPLVAAIAGIGLSCVWTPNIARWFASPLTNLFDGGSEAPDQKPFYTVARADLQCGKVLEAVRRIKEQLEKFPDDYEGLTLLAHVYATRFLDVASAHDLIEQIQNPKRHSADHRARALFMLAEWYATCAKDADSMRLVLERVIWTFPGTVHAQTARRRLNRLARRIPMGNAPRYESRRVAGLKAN